MSGYVNYDDIESQLQAFIEDTNSSNTNSVPGHEEPSTVLYGHTTLEKLRDHHKVRNLAILHDQNARSKECNVLLRGNLKGHVLFRITVHNSILYDCILIECTIYGSKIELSRLEDCRVRKKVLGTHDSTAESPFISCCQIENTSIHDSEIFNSTINGGLSIQNSELENTLAIHSLVLGSKLKECGIKSSELHGCKATGCLLTESVENLGRNADFSLAGLPPPSWSRDVVVPL